ncbi:hypothetical protein [Ideonella sp. B508-1]|nr:hypothetical protein [Ideonella sp. B508-1]
MKRAGLLCALAVAVLASGCATKSRCECCVSSAATYSTNYGGNTQ